MTIKHSHQSTQQHDQSRRREIIPQNRASKLSFSPLPFPLQLGLRLGLIDDVVALVDGFERIGGTSEGLAIEPVLGIGRELKVAVGNTFGSHVWW